MINLSDRFALLETGQIEPLFYDTNEPHDAFEEDGEYYLCHDVWFSKEECAFLGVKRGVAYRRDKIIQTSNSIGELQTTELWQKTHKREVE